MITLFASPKPFKDPHIRLIQRNAIQSWLRIRPKAEVVLVGDEEGFAETAAEFGLRHAPKVEKNEHGIPLRSSVFQLGARAASNDLLCYLNGDILTPGNFFEALRPIQFPKFLVVGQRWDLDVRTPIDFGQADWEEQIERRRAAEGRLHHPSGCDYFIFPRHSAEEMMLPFSMNTPGNDGWLLYRFRSMGLPVIDATAAIKVVHQEHEQRSYARTPEDRERIRKELAEAGGLSCLMTLRDADWTLTSGGLRRPRFPRNVFSLLANFRPWRLALAAKGHCQDAVEEWRSERSSSQPVQ